MKALLLFSKKFKMIVYNLLLRTSDATTPFSKNKKECYFDSHLGDY